MATGLKLPAAQTIIGPHIINIDPNPLFSLSPYLFLQFMEPLGVTDSSVEAAWDDNADAWRQDFVDVVQDLAPDVIRWGGLISRYYKWREGVGPVKHRPSMRNHVWGGTESNRVGTGEFVDLCRRVGAEPLLCVNFLSDGRKQYSHTREGQNRTGDAYEAADWVSYVNDPDNAERHYHGVPEPYGVKLWQIGDEISYGQEGFARSEAIDHTIAFARAMKARDRSIQLIGWGDRGLDPQTPLWAEELLQRAGGDLDYVAIHMMQQIPKRPDTVLDGRRYQQEPERAWQELLELSHGIEARLIELEQVITAQKAKTGIAVTEGHLSLRPHNANPLLTEWLTGAYHARAMNLYQRHGAFVKMATGADFNGTRWTVMAVMLQVPRGISYLTPVGSVMRLFKRYQGHDAVEVRSAPSDLDIAASRTADTVFLHVANLNYGRSVEAVFAVEQYPIIGGRVFEIAPDHLRQAVSQDQPDVFVPKERSLGPGPEFKWRFPAASVSVVELRSCFQAGQCRS